MKHISTIKTFALSRNELTVLSGYGYHDMSSYGLGRADVVAGV
jgi:hypothetical protein